MQCSAVQYRDKQPCPSTTSVMRLCRGMVKSSLLQNMIVHRMNCNALSETPDGSFLSDIDLVSMHTASHNC